MSGSRSDVGVSPESKDLADFDFFPDLRLALPFLLLALFVLLALFFLTGCCMEK